ncbi:hypothetical protein INS49_012753 [Diaporthe citri]|uniref:uncharacterized protein n=1 Tax=Diaporthe citri TaxID=83186 RepID=UPI001C7F240A|nr:uncharacterized protein INS49_012753 [Diaporthe citri]KAG6359232.1 hypothetical protein INS49_012753 [Diaporthe citri]
MQENVAKLYPNPETSAKVLDYSISKSTNLPDWLLNTYEAQALVFLSRLVGAKRVLEIGVYIGFSAMAWSHGVGKDGQVVGLELSEKYARMAGKAFKDNGVENVDIKIGDAVESLASLESSEPFDLIFLDANKDAYPKYLELILSKSAPGSPPGRRLLKAGGLIVADNVLQQATVADPTPSNPNYVEGVAHFGEQRVRELNAALHEFNDKLVAEPRLEAFLVPLFDGLGLARLLD